MIFLAIKFLSAVPPLGALPSTWFQYASSIDTIHHQFHCFDGSGVINLSQLNDDYLDCKDGSDEPGTSIGLSPQFYCSNQGTLPLLISRWSVSDGLCDCCDGSDESSHPSAHCPNVCPAQESERQAWIAKLTAIFSEGLAARNELFLTGQKLFDDANTSLNSLQELIRQLEENRTRTEAEGRAKKNTPTEEVVTPAFTPFPTEELPLTPPHDADLSFNEPEITPFPIAEPPVTHPHDNDLHFDEPEIIPSPIEELPLAPPHDDDLDLDEPEIIPSPIEELPLTPRDDDDLDFDEPEIIPSPIEEPSLPPQATPEVDNFDFDDDFERYEPPPTPSPTSTSTPNWKYGDLPHWKQHFVRAWQFTFRVPDRSTREGDPPKEPTGSETSYEPLWDSETQAQLDLIDRQLTEKRDELNKAEKVAKLKDEDPAYRALLGQEFKNGEYTLKLLQEFKHDWTLLGRYDKIDGRVMHFTGGDYCWQVKKGRESVVTLVCSNETKFIEVVEGPTCFYNGTFLTPAACRREDLEELSRMALSELKAFAGRSGLLDVIE